MNEKIRSVFYKKFSSNGALYFAPGRVNLIGEHTDYNNGFVLPGAINSGITLEIAPNNANNYCVLAIDFSEEVCLNSLSELPKKQWAKYIFGVISEIKKRGYEIHGFNCAFAGNVPKGAGMSSSAALESAFAFAINDVFKLNISKLELAKIGQAAEHNYVGVRCGIMDQFASIHGEKKSVIKLDCKTLEYELIPFEISNYKMLLIDTRVKHSLADSQYNIRRAQCEEGVDVIKQKFPSVESLCDVSLDMLSASKNNLSNIVFNRCRYVIDENNRVQNACKALKTGDLKTLGNEMFASHNGLKNLYEVSCEQLDFLVDLALESNGKVYARMMGGGFGGCTINLIENNYFNSFLDKVIFEYEKKFDKKPFYYEFSIEDGANKL